MAMLNGPVQLIVSLVKKKVHSKSSLAMVNCLFRARTRMMSEKVVKSFYHQSDQLYDIGSYKAGDYIGEWKYFHRNGQIRKIGSYYEYSEGFFWNGFRHGEWKYYDEDGKLYKTEYHEKDSITKTMKF